MKFLALFLPIIFLAVFIYASVKKLNVYDSFIKGVSNAPKLILSIFPYLTGILILCELFEVSGLSQKLTELSSPIFSFLGIPEEIVKLVIIKPFSGSGSTALFTEIVERYGSDSYIGRCAATCYSSSETFLYVSAVYFSNVKKKSLASAIVICVIISFFGMVFGCFLCRFL